MPVKPAVAHGARRIVRVFLIVALVPFGIGLLVRWTSFGILAFMLVAPAAALAMPVATLMWVVRGVRLTRGTHRAIDRVVAIGTAPLLLVVLAATAWPLLAIGEHAGALAMLLLNHRRYEAAIAAAQADARAGTDRSRAATGYIVDRGPPVRVAFDPVGLLDNWSGIVHDPTGDVMLARGFDPVTGRFFAPTRVTKLFDGDLVQCRHLWRSYYDCGFT